MRDGALFGVNPGNLHSIIHVLNLARSGAEGNWPAQRVLETFSPDNLRRIN